MSLALIESFGRFAETTGETIMKESSLQDLLQWDGLVSFGQGRAEDLRRT